MEYPLPCNNCKNTIYGDVPYCPYCGSIINFEKVQRQDLEENTETNIKSVPCNENDETNEIINQDENIVQHKDVVIESAEREKELKKVKIIDPQYDTEYNDKDAKEIKKVVSVWNNKYAIMVFISLLAIIIITKIFNDSHEEGVYDSSKENILIEAKKDNIAAEQEKAEAEKAKVDIERVKAQAEIAKAKADAEKAKAEAKKVTAQLEAEKSKWKNKNIIAKKSKNINTPKNIENNNVEISSYVNEGKRYYNMGKYELAIEKMKEVLRRDNRNATAIRYVNMAKKKINEINEEFENPQVGESR